MAFPYLRASKIRECIMENVITFTMTFVSVKDIIIPCLKLERGNVCSLFLKVTLFRVS